MILSKSKLYSIMCCYWIKELEGPDYSVGGLCVFFFSFAVFIVHYKL